MTSPNLFRTLRIDNWGSFMLNKLNNLYLKEQECDLTLVFSDKREVKVHKVLMFAASGYMSQYLMQNAQRNVVLLPPAFHSEGSIAIIEFIYTGRLDVKEGMVEQIFEAAQLFDIPVLEKLMDSQKQLFQEEKKIIKPKMMLKSKSEALPASQHYSSPSAQYSGISRDILSTKVSTPVREEEPRPTRFVGPAMTLTPTDVSGDMTYNAHALETQLASPLLPSLRVTAAAIRRKKTEAIFEELKAGAKSLRAAGDSGPTPKRICKEDLKGMKEFAEEQRLRKEQLMNDDDHAAGGDEDYAHPHDFEDDEDMERSGEEAPPGHNKLKDRAVPIVTNQEMEVTVVQGSTPNSSVVTLYGTDHQILMTKEIPEAPLEINVPNKLVSEILKSVPELVLEQSSVQLKIVKRYLDPVRRTMKTRISRIALRASTTDKPPNKTQTPPPEPEEDPKAIVGDLKVSPFEIRNGPWICQTCTDQADDVDCRMTLYYDWREHLIDVHGFRADPNICEFCGFKALKKNFMLYHQYVVHHVPTPASAYFAHCAQCDYIGVNAAAMRRHATTHGDEKQSLCKTCSSIFSTPEELHAHIQEAKHTRYAMGYLCPVCHEQFGSDVELHDHIACDHKHYASKLASEGGFPEGLGHPFPPLSELTRQIDGEAPKLVQEGQQNTENGNGIFPDNPPEYVGVDLDSSGNANLQAPELEPEGQEILGSVEASGEGGTVLMANSTIINPDGSMAVMLEGSDSYTIIPADSYRYGEDGSLQILQD